MQLVDGDDYTSKICNSCHQRLESIFGETGFMLCDAVVQQRTVNTWLGIAISMPV